MEFRRRVRTLQGLLEAKRLPGTLLSHPHDVFYYTGYPAGTDDHPLALIPAAGKPVLLLSALAVPIRAYGQVLTDGKAFSRHLPRRVGIDETSLSVASFLSLRKRTRPVPAGELIKRPRQVKDASELACMRAAVRVDRTVFRSLRLEGTEQEVARRIREAFHARGAEEAYEAIVATGRNAGTSIHHVPTAARLSRQATTIVDAGASLGGYSTDVTRTFWDSSNRVQQDLADTVKALQEECISRVAPGVKFSSLDAFYKRELGKRGFTVRHGLGHGIGIFVHEPAEKLEKGMVITIEPGIYTGSMGCRIEDMVLVTRSGREVLTRSVR
ncbi:MAG: aminopeptidase P family protein [Candidatus Aenigmarchaeota archaeon]|nr:aminopeptidase P family protein [Candidatus Aenigmarchaeota archaeon]